MPSAPATRSTGDAARGALAAARERPALAPYLLALATLGWKWLSPLSSFYSRGEWCDVFIAAAAAAWFWERQIPRLRPFHLILAAYLALVAVSALAAGGGARTVLLVVELAVLTV